MAHPNRLMILCILCEGERSVSELEQLLALRQPTVSQQLARLREDGLVKTRRQGKTSITASPAMTSVSSSSQLTVCSAATAERRILFTDHT